MAVTNKNQPLLHRKEFQMMTPLSVVASGAGSFVVAPDSGNSDDALFMTSLANNYFLYSHREDSFVQIPSGTLAGTFGAGACGVRHPWSNTYTATGGSTTTVQVALNTHNITGWAVGQKIEFVAAGVASGFRSTITGISTSGVAGSTITLTFADVAPTTILNTHTFRLATGRYFILNAGTVAAGSFKSFDVATMSWSGNLVVTNLPASWGTDGELVLAYQIDEIYATGTATAGSGTTLTNSAKSWTTNQWTNYQVRITAGTGMGQTRQIASNTATVLTTAAWTTNPDATSVYAIEASEDYIYAIGNNAVTMYRYSVSANTWTVMAPTTARGGAPVAGMNASAVGVTGDATWAAESAILDGRYIYSFRGATALLDRFDIAGGTAGAGAWAAVTYIGTETFATGSSAFVMGKNLYVRQNALNRFFKYDVVENVMKPLAMNLYTDGAAVIGQKIWVKNFDASETIQWLYAWQNTGTAVHRVMLF